MISVERLSDVFVGASDTLVDGFDAIVFLHGLMSQAAAITGAEAVGMLVADTRGELQSLASGDGTGRMLTLVQLEAQEGPCVESYLTGAPVESADLASATSRWPTFAPAAIDAGFGSVHACPLRLREQRVGALNLFGRAETPIAPREVRVVQSLVDIATIALLQQRAIAEAVAVAEHLQRALDSRIVIEQAKGAIAQREGVVPAEAFRLLRARARGSGRRLSVIAAEVLEQIEHRPGEDAPLQSG